MSKTITLTETSLKKIVRMAIKMGSMNLGAKQDRLVKAVFEEAEEKAVEVSPETQFPVAFEWRAGGGGCGSADILTKKPASLRMDYDFSRRTFRDRILMDDEIDPKDVEPGPARFLPRASDKPPNSNCHGGYGTEDCPRYGDAKDDQRARICPLDGLDCRCPDENACEPDPEADVETGYGIEKCCPSLPADFAELANGARRHAAMKKAAKAISLDISDYDDFLRLNKLTTEQLEQVIHIARP